VVLGFSTTHVSAIAGHASDNPSTSNHQVGGKKGQVKIPCWLCKEMHCTYLFPRMDEASKLLEHIVISQQQPPVASHEPSPNQPLVDEVVGLIPSSVDPSLPLESEVNKVVDPIQSSIDPTLPLESEVDTTGLSCHFRFLQTRGNFTHFNGTPSKY
jgi:hypothetical protein